MIIDNLQVEYKLDNIFSNNIKISIVTLPTKKLITIIKQLFLV